jgi:hypothetical protein
VIFARYSGQSVLFATAKKVAEWFWGAAKQLIENSSYIL